MHDFPGGFPAASKPRKLDAFIEVLGAAPGTLSPAVLAQARVMAATSNDGVVLMVGPSALWLIPWVMDALQPGTRAIALVEPGTGESLVQRLGALVQDDLRLALRVQDAPSFLADMGDQKFDLIIDIDQAAAAAQELAQIYTFGSLILGNAEPIDIDPKDAISLPLVSQTGDYAGQLIKPRPATLRRRGGRKTRLVGREPGAKPPKELFEGAFPPITPSEPA